MKKIIKISYLGFLFVILLNSNLSGQINTAYWMKNLPQQMNENPAKVPACKLFIEMPILPNFSINAFHSGFTLNDAVKVHPTAVDSFMIDLDGIESALSNKNSINLETNISVLNIGLSLKSDFFITFGVNYKIFENFQYPKALIELRRGNYREDETPLSFDFGQNLMIHREIFAGVSKEVYPGLTVGGRLKFLSGYANIKTNQMKIDWYTETHTDSMYDWTFESDFDIRASLPMEWDLEYDGLGGRPELYVADYNPTDSISKLLFPGNSGLGVDLGVEYSLFDRFIFSASLIDFGYIKWKKNTAILTQQASFTFSGLDIGRYIGSLEDATNVDETIGQQIADDMIDTLLNVFNPNIEHLAYRTGLNTKIYLGANAALTKWLDFGFLYRGAFVNQSLISSYTVSANANFLKGWSFSISNSIMDGLFLNLGMGLAYRLGPIQMYAVTENVAVPFWLMNGSSVADNWLRNTKRANFAFGLNILICRNKFDIGLIE